MDAPAAPRAWHVDGVGDKSCTHLPSEVADGSPCRLEHPYALKETSPDEQLRDRAVDRVAPKMKQAVERGEADMRAVPQFPAASGKIRPFRPRLLETGDMLSMLVN